MDTMNPEITLVLRDIEMSLCVQAGKMGQVNKV